MDPLSALASIIAIVGFASKGLEVIGNFKEFCGEFSADATKDFLHDIEVTVNILTDVKILSQKMETVAPTVRIDYRATALAIQVDDCVRDLECWLDIALNIKKERGSRTRGQKRQFFNSVLTAISKGGSKGRASAKERLRGHQQNIKTTLSLFGRHMDIANNISLSRIDDSVHQIAGKVSENAEELSRQLSCVSASISSSNDSLQAHKSEMSDKLDQVTNLLQQVLSSESSQSSRNKRPRSRSYNEGLDNEHGSSKELEPNFVAPARQSTVHTQASISNVNAEAEFETLYRATMALINLVQQIYHPLIAEFLSTKHAWDTLEFQLRCLIMEPVTVTWTHAFKKDVGTNKIYQMKRAAATRLISIRKQCVPEGLLETLETVMTEVGILERDVKLWEQITAQTPYEQQTLNLDALMRPSHDEQRQDRLTRMNEWLLGVFDAFPMSLELYSQIISPRKQFFPGLAFVHYARHGQSVDSQLKLRHPWDGFTYTGLFPISEFSDRTHAAARRAVVKFWFLDTAAMSQEEYTASLVPGSDSDATFRWIGKDDQDDELDVSFENTDGKESGPFLADLPTESLNLQSGAFDKARSLGLYEDMALDLAGDEESHRLLSHAQQALSDYSKEPSKAPTFTDD